MDFEIGDRVKSSEVPPRDSGGAYQEKHLEIVEILDGQMVRCQHWVESKVNPSVEWFVVPVASLTFVNKVPLSYKGPDKDKFFDRFKT